MYEVGIGLLGLGVVGSAVAKAITEGNSVSTRSGVGLILRGVAVKDPKKKRSGCDISADLIHQDANAVINRDDIDVIVEVIGGVDPAFEYISFVPQPLQKFLNRMEFFHPLRQHLHELFPYYQRYQCLQIHDSR